ncbi:hypothetical protein E1180_20500 [Roseibium denhamense]|uniref:Uncharacterized protein n=1 Tax=Roseibium denhamense TaxID=76305 RepID=A0ABY1NPB8_9HYPH|nr:hypothetical protein [Roseibium denhamense]MTI07885.1 hypothetical protein [Roseibium denhamense]SMP14727.1 hypothetical protein SAMN06265374_1467 [Roseibium denhamense]
MKRCLTFIVAFFAVAGGAMAAGIPQPGDFYLISRNDSGTFVGSHKLFREYSKGLKKVAYCGRDYYVRGHSVAWTHLEVERGNLVQIEYNFGRGWRPICQRPDQQVQLTDIGIDLPAEQVLLLGEGESGPKSRLSAIGALFQPSGIGNKEGSFHLR